MLWATNKNCFLPCSALAQCVPHCNLLSYTEDTLVFMALSLSYSSGQNTALGTSPQCLKQRSWCQSKRSDFILCHLTEGQGSAWRALWGLRAVQSWVGGSWSGHRVLAQIAGVLYVQNQNQKTLFIAKGQLRGMHSHARSHVVLFTSLSLPVSSFVSQLLFPWPEWTGPNKDAVCEAAVRQLINDLMNFTFLFLKWHFSKSWFSWSNLIFKSI